MNTQHSQVCIVDDDIDVCKSLLWLLQSINISSEYYTDPNQFLKCVTNNTADCILMDIRMPNVNGLSIARELHQRKINTPIIFITGHADISVAIDAMKGGAFDFITKPIEGKKITRVILNALQHSQTQRLQKSKSDKITDMLETLSKREKEVLKLVIAGKNSQEIANQLIISLKTVESHRYRILKKMEVSTTVQLTALLSKVDEALV